MYQYFYDLALKNLTLVQKSKLLTLVKENKKTGLFCDWWVAMVDPSRIVKCVCLVHVFTTL